MRALPRAYYGIHVSCIMLARQKEETHRDLATFFVSSSSSAAAALLRARDGFGLFSRSFPCETKSLHAQSDHCRAQRVAFNFFRFEWYLIIV